jgi:hypothetical protein
MKMISDIWEIYFLSFPSRFKSFSMYMEKQVDILININLCWGINNACFNKNKGYHMNGKLPYGLTIIGRIISIPVKGKGNIETRTVNFRDEDMTDFCEILLSDDMTWGSKCNKTMKLAQEILSKYIPIEETAYYCSYLFNELSLIPRDLNFHIDIPIRKYTVKLSQ